MSIVDTIIVLLMAVGTVVFVGEPLVRRVFHLASASDNSPEMERLALQKETLYTAIRDLDFDFQTDKVDQKDYTELRQHLEGEALQLLHQFDTVDPLAELDVELERQISALRQQRFSPSDRPSQSICSRCGSTLQGDGHFCPICGQPLMSS
jgi:rubrerythrin